MKYKKRHIKAYLAILIFIAPLFIQLAHSFIHTHHSCHHECNDDGFKHKHKEDLCLINDYEFSIKNIPELVEANSTPYIYKISHSFELRKNTQTCIHLLIRLRAPPARLNYSI